MGRSAILQTSTAAVIPNSPRLMCRSMHRSPQHSRSASWFVPSITRPPNAYCIFISQKVVLVLGLRTYTTWQTSEACSMRTTKIPSSAHIQRNTYRRALHPETIKKASLSKLMVAMLKQHQLCSNRLAQLEMPRDRKASQTQPTFLPADTDLRSCRIS